MITYTLSYFNFVKEKWIDFDCYSLMFTGKNGYGLPMEKGEFNYQTHLSYGTGTDSCEPSHVCNLRMVGKDEVMVAEKFRCKLTELKDKHCIRLHIDSSIPFFLNSYLIKLVDKGSFEKVDHVASYFFSLGDHYWHTDKLVKRLGIYVDKSIDLYFGISVQLLKKADKDLEFNLLIALDVTYR